MNEEEKKLKQAAAPAIPAADDAKQAQGAQTIEPAQEQSAPETAPQPAQGAEEPEAEHEGDEHNTDEQPDEMGATASDEAASDVVKNADEQANADANTNINAADDINARVGWLTAQLLTAKATAAATALGIPPEKAKYALRLADLGQIDVTSDDADKRISAAMGQVIKDLPELAAKPQQTTGTPGMFARQSSAPASPFERGLMGK